MKFGLCLSLSLLFCAPAFAGEPLHMVQDVQKRANTRILYVPEKRGEDVWRMPTSEGDCEDFALLKRQMLIDRGWNPKDLALYIVTRDMGYEAHVVLVVKSLAVVLDMPLEADKNNRQVSPPVVPVSVFYRETGYRYFCEVEDLSLGSKPAKDRCKY